MKAKELREQSTEELQKTLYETSKQLFQLRMKNSTGQLNKSHELKKTQRNVARIQTILNEKKQGDSK